MQRCESEGRQQWREKWEPADCNESFEGGCSAACLSWYDTNHSASTHCTWRDADAIGSHLLDCVAVAVQRCTGMALRASVEREMARVVGARAA